MELVCNESDLFSQNNEENYRKRIEKADIRKNLISTYNEVDIERSTQTVHALTEEIRAEWPSLFGEEVSKIFVHVDLDSFYASCEMLINPSLRNVPIGVGNEMMLATSNYEARKYGVKAGMPGYKAKRLCPELVIVKCDFPKYNYYSECVLEVLAMYDDEIEIYGMDEACLIFDQPKFEKALTKLRKSNLNEFSTTKLSFNNIERLVNCIRQDVCKSTGLTISAGISVCRGLAKLCSDMNKPDGQFTLSEHYHTFLHKLKVDKLNGIGKSTKMTLERTFKIKTVGELKLNMPLINLVYPYKTFLNLLRLSHGLICFDYPHSSGLRCMKGVARDVTFPSTDSYTFLCETLWLIAKELASRLSNKKKYAKIVTIKIRYHNFVSTTKQRKLKCLITSDVEIFDEAYKLFMELFSQTGDYKTFMLDNGVNLIGIRLSDLNRKEIYNCLDMFKYRCREPQIKICTMCNYEMIGITNIEYEKHVRKCIERERIINEKKPAKKTILDYLKQI